MTSAYCSVVLRAIYKYIPDITTNFIQIFSFYLLRSLSASGFFSFIFSCSAVYSDQMPHTRKLASSIVHSGLTTSEWFPYLGIS
jgi:hypothetical protein